MGKSRQPYGPDFRERMIELVRAGRSPEELAKEFEPSAQTIRNWLKQGGLDEGTRSDGLTSEDVRSSRDCAGRTNSSRSSARSQKKSRGLVRSGERLDPQAGFDFVRRHQAEFPIRAICRVLGVSPSGYYAWLDRRPSAREMANDELVQEMQRIHAFSRRSYGRPRMHAELRDEGFLVNHKRVGRLMRLAGIVGVTRRRK